MPASRQFNLRQQQQQRAEPFTKNHKFINGGCFVPVFENAEELKPRTLPRNANPAKYAFNGNVPWKCLFCEGHDAFGEKCSKCRRPRNSAAIRLFVGQLSKEGGERMIKNIIDCFTSAEFASKTFGESTPLLSLNAPLVFVEEHTDAQTGQSKGCVWLYCSCIQDMDRIIDAVHKRCFVTVSQQTGEAGFVAFPSSASHEEIEHAFQHDRASQSAKIRELFLFSTISVQIPNSIGRFVNEFRRKEQEERVLSSKNNNKEHQQQGLTAAIPKSARQNLPHPEENHEAVCIPEIVKKPVINNKNVVHHNEEPAVVTVVVDNRHQVEIHQQNNNIQVYSWNETHEDNNFNGSVSSEEDIMAHQHQNQVSINNNNNGFFDQQQHHHISAHPPHRRIIVHNPYQYTAWQFRHEQYYSIHDQTNNNKKCFVQNNLQPQQQFSCNKLSYQQQREIFLKHQMIQRNVFYNYNNNTNYGY